MSVLKDDFGEMLKLFIDDDKFLSSLLDEAEIYKKKNYQKQIAESMKKMAELKEKELLNGK